MVELGCNEKYMPRFPWDCFGLAGLGSFGAEIGLLLLGPSRTNWGLLGMAGQRVVEFGQLRAQLENIRLR